MSIEIIAGHDLSDTIIEMMNKQRIHEYEVNTKNFRQNEQDSTFFFAKNNGDTKAFGMLKPVTIIHQGKMTGILGIGNIIAVEKGTGNGKQLMLAIKDYLTDKRRIGLGFCNPGVEGFYRNCGYQMIGPLSGRFCYPLAELTDKRERLNEDLNILCHDPIGGFIEALQATSEPIYINQPFW